MIRGVVMKRSGPILALTLALAIVAGHGASAFQEQKAGVAPPAAAPATPAPETAVPADQSNLGSESVAKPETGTEISIPGLGRLGVLPKMDFGLELLYGAAEGQSSNQNLPAQGPEDDLTVRGSVKHRF
jgi:hypothetical protein